jgi:transcriptional regulator with XRE-family HTH domain
MTSDDVNKLVGSQIREARHRASLTQSALAERAGVAFEAPVIWRNSSPPSMMTSGFLTEPMDEGEEAR